MIHNYLQKYVIMAILSWELRLVNFKSDLKLSRRLNKRAQENTKLNL